MEVITKEDLILINELSSRSYSGNRLLSNASNNEKSHLAEIKRKLKTIAEYYSKHYSESYGEFDTSVSTGNDIAIGGTSFKRIWSGIFKGAENKQYAAQISFVMDPIKPCLNVGFYFGRASGHSLNKTQRNNLESQLQKLADNLVKTIESNEPFRRKYNSLLDFGFKAYAGSEELQGAEWMKRINSSAKSSQIYAKIFPNDFGVIDNSTVDSYVAQIVFLMGGVSPENVSSGVVLRPLSPEQRAKQAERNAEIGLKGELLIMEKERKRLLSLHLNNRSYPKHVALESMHHGYDILSLDEKGDEIYIEVKTTTRLKKDPSSKVFFLSTNELETFENESGKYRLYRVYDIEGRPDLDIVDLNKVEKRPDGYICNYM